MNYDIIVNIPKDEPKEEENEEKGKETIFFIGIIVLCLVVIIIIVVLGYFAYKFFLKKKTKTDEELYKDIDGVDASLDIESNAEGNSQLNNDERI